MSDATKKNRRKWRKRGGKDAFELGAMQGGKTELSAAQKRWVNKLARQ